MKTKEEATTRIVAKINNVNIVVIENGDKRVAIRPICDVLGVSIQSQLDRLKDDPILSSTVTPSMMVGADGKQREMQTIPLKFVFGWLFRIDSRNVKEEARENVLRYQLACYNALYNFFASQNEYLEERQAVIESHIEEVSRISEEFSSAKNRLKDAKDALQEARKISYDSWLAARAQQSIEFPEQNNGGLSHE